MSPDATLTLLLPPPYVLVNLFRLLARCATRCASPTPSGCCSTARPRLTRQIWSRTLCGSEWCQVSSSQALTVDALKVVRELLQHVFSRVAWQDLQLLSIAAGIVLGVQPARR
eukprot:scaffold9128_cov126-Isochrysis_galbana.AAC.6